jgi:hypothetical protein
MTSTYQLPVITVTNTTTTTETTTMNLKSMMSLAATKNDLMVAAYNDGDELSYVLLKDELDALEADIVDLAEAELCAEQDAEQSKMDRDVQEFNDGYSDDMLEWAAGEAKEYAVGSQFESECGK